MVFSGLSDSTESAREKGAGVAWSLATCPRAPGADPTPPKATIGPECHRDLWLSRRAHSTRTLGNGPWMCPVSATTPGFMAITHHSGVMWWRAFWYMYSESNRVLKGSWCLHVLCFIASFLPCLFSCRLVSVLKFTTNKDVHGHLQKRRAASVHLRATWKGHHWGAFSVFALHLLWLALCYVVLLMVRWSYIIFAKNMTHAHEKEGSK